MKVIGPTTDFPTWGSTKGLRTPREFDFEGQWGLITELPLDWGNRLLEAQKTPCAHQEPGESSSDPTRD